MRILRVNKELYWIIGSQLVSLVSNFLLLKLLTANLSMTAYGYYILWVSIILFLRQMIYDPISIIAAKESMESNFLGIQGLSGFQIIDFITSKIFMSLLIPCTIIALIDFILNKELTVGIFLLTGIIYLTSNGSQGILINIMNILKNRRSAATGIITDSLTKLILIYLIFMVGKINLTWTILAVALSSFLSFLYVKKVSKKFYGELDIGQVDAWGISKKLSLLSLPLFASTFIIALKTGGDKFFMASFIGVEDLAAYNVLFQLGFIPMMLIIGVIQTYVSPDIYKHASTKDKGENNLIKYINKIIFKILFLAFICAGTSLFIADKLFYTLVGHEYLNYSKFLPCFVLAGTFAGVSSLLNVGVIAVFKSKQSGIFMFISVFLSILILMLSIGFYGFEGGVLGIILSNLIMLIIFMISLKFASCTNE